MSSFVSRRQSRILHETSPHATDPLKAVTKAHASGFLVRKGFPHLSGSLNSLEFHTNLVAHDPVGQYSIKPELFDALTSVMEEQENL
jgi:hypothetical protein